MNSRRGQLLCECPDQSFNQQERLTAIRGPTDSRHTLVDAALSRAIPKARVLCLKHESSSYCGSFC
jgi:hypothetical protein